LPSSSSVWPQKPTGAPSSSTSAQTFCSLWHGLCSRPSVSPPDDELLPSLPPELVTSPEVSALVLVLALDVLVLDVVVLVVVLSPSAPLEPPSPGARPTSSWEHPVTNSSRPTDFIAATRRAHRRDGDGGNPRSRRAPPSDRLACAVRQ